MEGKSRFEFPSTSPEDGGFISNYPNGQRVNNYSGVTLDRSAASLRDGGESRICGNGSRGIGSIVLTGDLPPLSQCLLLDPISMHDNKYTRSGELRRALGFPFGSSVENTSFGAAHCSPISSFATDELKRFKASVADACFKAKGRAKRLAESLHKLNKYCDVLGSKKQLRNERSGGSNFLKMGSPILQNPPDHVTQKVEDGTKNVALNKRVRTSVAETRGEGRSSGIPRQPSGMGKDRDILKDGGSASDVVEEKIRKLPAGGEGWDKKMRRKRSVGTVFTRPGDSGGQLKQAMHHKLSSEPGLQSSDPSSLISGSSNCASFNKIDGSSLAASLITRSTSKAELEKFCLSRDQTVGLNKERLVTRGIIKSSRRADNHNVSGNPMIRGKTSRALRTGPAIAVNSSPSFSRACGALESWEQPQNVGKVSPIGGANMRKRPMPRGSSSPPMAQWVGQRPQKISRTRRANLVSPVLNHDDAQMSSEGCSTPDFGSRISSSDMDESIVGKGAGNGFQQIKVKGENISSPPRLSESEESGAGGNRFREKGVACSEAEENAVNAVNPYFVQGVECAISPPKKNNSLIKEQSRDGVRRQVGSGRGSLVSRGRVPAVEDKLDGLMPSKPLRPINPGSDKNGSKTGRPLKVADCKAFTRNGLLQSSGFQDYPGESDDDHEELLAAAKFACAASYTACSGSIWKKMEPIFAFLSVEDLSFLKQQGELAHEEISFSENVLNEPALCHDVVDRPEDDNAVYGRVDSEMFIKAAPLYQRVLSALIIESGTEIFQDISGSKVVLSPCAMDVTSFGARLHFNVEVGVEDLILGNADTKSWNVNNFPCNGNTKILRGSSIYNHRHSDALQGCGFTCSDVRALHMNSQNGINGLHDVRGDVYGISSIDCLYDDKPLDEKVLLELQSIGLYPEPVPHLADGDGEVITQEIMKLKQELCQEVVKKKGHLDKICKAYEKRKEVEERKLEQVAMDRLVELAYQKQLATRGSSASKSGVTKVSRQVALACVRRTLDRCRKFEDTGNSCFSERALRDAIFAVPPRVTDSDSIDSAGLAGATNLHPGTRKSQREPRVSGSLHSGAEGHNLKNGQSERGLVTAFEALTSSSDLSFEKNGPVSSRGKKKEVFLDDVGGCGAVGATSALGSTLTGVAKGKRSVIDRNTDTFTRNPVVKAGRLLIGNFKSERKTKSKQKLQKTTKLLASGNGFTCRLTDAKDTLYPLAGDSSETTSGTRKQQEVGSTPRGSISQDSMGSKEHIDFTNLQLLELDTIEELDVANDLGGNQDLSSWLNFDEDGLQDHDSMGLEIPMDDLSDLNMLL